MALSQAGHLVQHSLLNKSELHVSSSEIRKPAELLCLVQCFVDEPGNHPQTDGFSCFLTNEIAEMLVRKTVLAFSHAQDPNVSIIIAPIVGFQHCCLSNLSLDKDMIQNKNLYGGRKWQKNTWDFFPHRFEEKKEQIYHCYKGGKRSRWSRFLQSLYTS